MDKVHDPVADLLLTWQARRDRGEPCTPEDLCRDRPELVQTLRQRINELQSMEAFLGKTVDAISVPETQANTLPPPAATTVDPTRIAVPGYEILAELGRGGMGVVYKARQQGLNRLVALKMVLAGAHAGPDALVRFLGEAESIAKLRHPNIVQVYEVGQHEGHPYFSLEYCDGGTLATKLNGTPLPPKDAAKLVETLANAVQAAHEAGIVHRDLKPANVLLLADGTPKIADFGLATIPFV